MGDVGKGPAVHNGGGALDGLHQVGVHGVPQQSGHGALGFDIAGVDRLAGVGVGDEDVPQALFQVVHVLGQAQDGHDLGGHGDDKAVLPGHAVDFAPQADDDVPQGAVVHIQAALDLDAPGVDAQGVSLLQVVIQHGAAQVVGGGDGVHVPGKVEVDVLHGQHLGIAAPRGAALDAEHRPQGGLPQGDNGVFANLRHGLAQARGGGGFALTGGGGVDGRHQHQLAVWLAGQAGKGPLVDFGLIPAVQFQLFLLDAQLRRDFRDGPERCALRDFDV